MLIHVDAGPGGFYAGAETEPGKPTIINVAPVLRKFRGQPVGNLLKWAAKHGFKVTITADTAFEMQNRLGQVRYRRGY